MFIAPAPSPIEDRAELSSAISLLTAEQPLFLPQYMHADVQVLLVQCAEFSANPLIRQRSSELAHARSHAAVVARVRVCAVQYATRLMCRKAFDRSMLGRRPTLTMFNAAAIRKQCIKLLHLRPQVRWARVRGKSGDASGGSGRARGSRLYSCTAGARRSRWPHGHEAQTGAASMRISRVGKGVNNLRIKS